MSAHSIERLPPHSNEAEQGVLGSLLLDSVNGMPIAIATIISSEAFYDLRLRTVWQQMVRMFEANLPVDTSTLMVALNQRGEIDAVGGIGFISALPDATPTAANLEYYLKVLMEKYLARELVRVSTRIVGVAFDSKDPIEEQLSNAEREILAIGRQRKFRDHTPVRDLVSSAMESIEADIARKGEPSGLTTGFIDLDRMTSGMDKKGEMIVLAGRPSLGKTSLAMNIAEHVALDLKLPVGVFSLEMSAESLVKRSIYSRARVNMRQAMDGFFADRDAPKLTHAAGKLSAAPLYIDDTVSGASIHELNARARRMVQMFGIQLFVIDYLQLVHGMTRNHRVTEMTEVSQGVKEMSRQLGVPVLVLSQLNRELEKEKQRKPRMSDLRDTGSIEQDADKIYLLYRPKDFTTEGDDDEDSIPVNLIIAKQRNGPLGEVHLTFLRPYTRFESAARVSADDVPEATSTAFNPVLSDPAGRSYT